MSLQNDVRSQLKVAMQNKDQAALDSLRALLAACTNEAISLGKSPQEELSDSELQNVVKRLIKQRKDSIEQFKSGGRTDLISTEEAQISVLEQFQPTQMTKEQVQEIAKRVKAEKGIDDKAKSGILVGAIMKEVGGNADGALVKTVVDELFVD